MQSFQGRRYICPCGLMKGTKCENPDLWKWLTSQEEPPEAVKVNPVFIAVWKKVTSNLENHAAPGTRATPDQSWVRGWDDFKKGRDSPISGNQ
ncbi:hypothetical protein SASPL_123155 [Salvia splendens]|uniref:Uncharacterized protein n=1 Tax=Salvia splendens TaxID=180675 RepID=A0A8X8XJU7_SALSN|nr:hypothetical protein SASPL_123155 [Salvia splendens]